MSNGIVPMPRRPRRAPLGRCSFRFDGRPHSVKDARAWLTARMRIAGVPEEAAENAVLLLSELATNSLAHSPSGAPGGTFTVRAFFSPGRLRIEVRDNGPADFPLPTAPPNPEAEHGRGLLLVDALAHHWGRFDSDHGPGMFAELRWNTQPTPTTATGHSKR